MEKEKVKENLSIKIPKDFIEKIKMFDEEQVKVVSDLIQQSYDIGYEDGRDDMNDEMYNK
ncbi:hypothetical protein D4R42_00385 [bacterium]|nr:MAG: hypothetical protein D4R42_00385 [bacterium]